MHAISQADIRARIERDNPWWETGTGTATPEAQFKRRVYFQPFRDLALNYGVRRAGILLGPRRVGKTVMIKQVIHEAIANGLAPRNVLYASIDTPLYSGLSLESFLSFLHKRARAAEQYLVVFDEIQYLKDWETHLKDLVDSYPHIKFLASGSAAAALRLKSKESGAGRFSEFMLPPLTFYEFLHFTDRDDLVATETPGEFEVPDIDELNASFVDYLNFGGYPEAVLNDQIRTNADQFIRIDIIEKVLLKDLPSLYGISDIQELNKLFMFLAYNAGNEASLANISQSSGLAAPTIKRYIEYLESAFLIIKVSTVDDNCRTPQRERHFKIFLNNTSMRAALFAPVTSEDTQLIGHLAESAVFSQWQHSPNSRRLRYARWKNEGEVDVVFLNDANERPEWIGEVKWSDRIAQNFNRETKSMRIFTSRHKSIREAFFTTRTYSDDTILDDRVLRIRPTALYCYMVGRNITSGLARAPQTEREDERKKKPA